jgi:hypothetical protein
MPQSRDGTKTLPREPSQAFNRADWVRSAACTRAGNALPDVVVLEGKNTLISGEEEKFSPHGYAVLALDGRMLKEEVRDATGAIIYDRVLVS